MIVSWPYNTNICKPKHLCQSLFFNKVLGLRHFLRRLFFPIEIVLTLCFISMYSVLNTLSEYAHFCISKNTTSYTFLLVFKIVESLQWNVVKNEKMKMKKSNVNSFCKKWQSPSFLNQAQSNQWQIDIYSLWQQTIE